MKKIFALILTVTLIFTFSVSAFALKSAGGTEYHEVIVNRTNEGKNSEVADRVTVQKDGTIALKPVENDSRDFEGWKFYKPNKSPALAGGNLRTALYSYLIAKHDGGKFILRIEDTDRERFVEGATDIIKSTLKITGLGYDEGPDVGGDHGPYVQSERKEIYMEYAKKLVDLGYAYYCFCTKERLEQLHDEDAMGGYDRHCRNLSKAEVEEKLAAGIPFVIRQKMPI